MKGREIPGFWLDERTGKYFAIQADHNAPPDAKYSKSNANEEKREAKRRRTQEAHDKILRKQTVPAARLLKHPLLGGSGLRREHGDRPFAYYTSNRESAFVHGLRSYDINLHITGFAKKDISILDAHYLPETSQSLMAISHGPGSHAIYCYDCHNNWGRSVTLPTKPAMYAFHNAISALTTATSQNTTYAIACTQSSNPHSGNVFVGRLPLPGQNPLHADPTVATSAWWNIGDISHTLWDCKVSPDNDLLAFSGTNGAVAYRFGDLAQYGEMFTDNTYEAYACGWLNKNTLAVGTSYKGPKQSNRDIKHEVNLWDVRTEDSAARFTRNFRSIGIQNPNNQPHQLLVADSRNIDLYDTRWMKDHPLLSLPHLCGSTSLQISIHDDLNLVAALDHRNKVQVYSLTSGQHLREFSNSGKGLLSNPRWQQDSRGRYLQVCGKNTILQWTWPGAEGEEDKE